MAARPARLDPAQREAVRHRGSHLLVLAGAGSGKTRVLTHRLAALIGEGVAPERILAVTFTNKAAEEMAERVGALVGPGPAGRLWLSTFHRFGLRMLQVEASRKGGQRFVVFDQGDSVGLVRELLRRTGAAGGQKLDAAAVHQRISLWKGGMVPPEQVPSEGDDYHQAARAVYADYEESLRAMHAVDFDDLVTLPARLLEEPDVAARWRGRFAHVLVDEFQDTSRAQLLLLQRLTGERTQVCVVGDDDQAIYGWRGAHVEHIVRFERYFRGARMVKLEVNYRSRAPIVEAADRVATAARRERHEKRLRSARGEGPPVELWALPDPAAEAQAVVAEIRRLQLDEKRPAEHFAILYRSSKLSAAFEEELRVAGLPYRVAGGTAFYDRKEVKDALAYLRVAAHPYDELSLRRIANQPPRGLGPASLQRLAEHARARRISLAAALREAELVEGLGSAARTAALRLGHTLGEAGQRLRRGEPSAQVARWLLETVGLRDELEREREPDRPSRRWANVESLLRALERFDRGERGEGATLRQFLVQLALRPEGGGERGGGRFVTLSTLHAAKGLEWPVVFLVGCVEGVLPHRRVLGPTVRDAAPTDVEEERRLFYVGITRARERLVLTRARGRRLRGKDVRLAPSRFLEDLPETVRHRSPTEEAPSAEELERMADELLARLASD